MSVALVKKIIIELILILDSIEETGGKNDNHSPLKEHTRIDELKTDCKHDEKKILDHFNLPQNKHRSNF